MAARTLCWSTLARHFFSLGQLETWKWTKWLFLFVPKESIGEIIIRTFLHLFTQPLYGCSSSWRNTKPLNIKLRNYDTINHDMVYTIVYTTIHCSKVWYLQMKAECFTTVLFWFARWYRTCNHFDVEAFKSNVAFLRPKLANLKKPWTVFKNWQYKWF